MDVIVVQEAMYLNDGAKASLKLAWGTLPSIIFGNKVSSSPSDMCLTPH